jgi:CubicO group peptidase (beta-lactamase class C family)
MKLVQMTLSILFATLVVCSNSVGAQEAYKEPCPGFDEYVGKVLKECDAAGIAIAVVKDDRVVFARGYGKRSLSKPDPVDEKTVFAIGSCSKAFTAALVATLVDRGLMSFDAKVTDYLPGFRIDDPWVSRELTVRDALSHRTGVPNRGWIWAFDRDEGIRRLRFEKPVLGFRAKYEYNNNMYVVAGQCAAAAAKSTWENLITETFLQPLHMTSSCATWKELSRYSNVAAPHVKVAGKLQVLPAEDRLLYYTMLDNQGPAGSIHSNVLDVAQFIRMQLAEGKFEGKQIVKPQTLKETHTAQMLITPATTSLYYSMDSELGRDLHAYGMGWVPGTTRGHKVVLHTGGTSGMRSLVELMPDNKTGFVILSNCDDELASRAIGLRLEDACLNLPLEDGLALLQPRARKKEMEARDAQLALEKKQVPGTKPSLRLDAYAGTYSHPEFGEITIKLEDGKLVIGTPMLKSARLSHWHYDTFDIRDNLSHEHGLVTFTLDGDGQVSGLSFGESETFSRRAEKK